MLATASATLCIAASPALAGNVDFAAPANGSILSSPVHVEFEVKGMTVRPAADGPISGTGHFHLIIDDGPTPKGVALPFDATHVHYGKGQIQADVELTPGPHVLTLQFADSNHVSYGLAYSSEVKVVVE